MTMIPQGRVKDEDRKIILYKIKCVCHLRVKMKAAFENVK